MSRSRSSRPGETTSCRSMGTRARCSRTPRRPFPPWMRADRQPDGLPTGVATPPIWLQRDLAERGGRISWFLDASPKARHGRRELRLFWALADPDQNAYVGSSGTHGTPWPHLRQIGAVERHRLQIRRGQVIATESEVRYYVTSLAPEQADAKALLALARGHWGIENRLHHVRDVTFDEDRSQMQRASARSALARSEEHTSELQSRRDLVCRLLLET